jgi:hypothetical protein
MCCGHLTMDEPASFQICPICFWEDDPVQLRWPDCPRGANKPSLIEAQENYLAFGACERRALKHVRPPKDDEPPDPRWRPIDPGLDSFEPLDAVPAAWPDDFTVLYWWRRPPAADREVRG